MTAASFVFLSRLTRVRQTRAGRLREKGGKRKACGGYGASDGSWRKEVIAEEEGRTSKGVLEPGRHGRGGRHGGKQHNDQRQQARATGGRRGERLPGRGETADARLADTVMAGAVRTWGRQPGSGWQDGCTARGARSYDVDVARGRGVPLSSGTRTSSRRGAQESRRTFEAGGQGGRGGALSYVNIVGAQLAFPSARIPGTEMSQIHQRHGCDYWAGERRGRNLARGRRAGWKALEEDGQHLQHLSRELHPMARTQLHRATSSSRALIGLGHSSGREAAQGRGQLDGTGPQCKRYLTCLEASMGRQDLGPRCE